MSIPQAVTARCERPACIFRVTGQDRSDVEQKARVHRTTTGHESWSLSERYVAAPSAAIRAGARLRQAAAYLRTYACAGDADFAHAMRGLVEPIRSLLYEAAQQCDQTDASNARARGRYEQTGMEQTFSLDAPWVGHAAAMASVLEDRIKGSRAASGQHE